MSRFRTTLLAAAVSFVLAAPSAARAQVVIQDFSSDPTQPRGNRAVFEIRGPGEDQFVYDPLSAPRFPGDMKGSLAVTYDSLRPTSRFFTTFAGRFTQDDDFLFGAVMTIRAAGLEADPFGFHPIAFSLFNAATTGDERTGNPVDFRADTFDTVEMAYFPNVSSFFGGPFLSPDVFGAQTSSDAFSDFTFGSVPFELRPGVTYLVTLEHSAAARTLTCRVAAIRRDGSAVDVPGGRVVVDTSRVGGFLVDSLGVSAYHDGFNEFSMSGRSLLATVDYDLIFSGPEAGGRPPADLMRVLKRFDRSARMISRVPSGQ
jgi:hypothetical protein